MKICDGCGSPLSGEHNNCQSNLFGLIRNAVKECIAFEGWVQCVNCKKSFNPTDCVEASNKEGSYCCNACMGDRDNLIVLDLKDFEKDDL